jgi:Fe-S cluster assembly protein SufD
MVTAMEPRSGLKPAAPMRESDPYWGKFEHHQRTVKDAAWVQAARRTAMGRFAELGFPTLQDEAWRFTNVAPIAKLPFRPVFEPSADGLAAETLSRLAFASLPGPRLVFLNGHFAATLSSVPVQPSGVKIGSLAAALILEPTLVEKHLFRYATADANAFAALNTAFFQDGAFICVGTGRALTEPVRALYLSTAKEHGAATHPRNLIIAEPGSQLTFIESYASLGDAAHVTNAVTELVAGDSAVVEHLKFQDENPHAFHLATLQAHLGRASNVIAHSVVTGAKLSRTDIHTTLAGEGLECVLNGLYLIKGDQLADHHMIIEHAQARCASHEYFNGVLADKAKGVFHGRILVRPGAQKTDAKQTNRNLLLSDDATVDTKPQLEIYADDVKCTHGATVGQLDEESIFYLRSRGLGLDTARRMLIHAFAGEIIERIRHEAAREQLDKLVWDRLEQHPLVAEKRPEDPKPE